MNKIHLSAAQRALAVEFSQSKTRPTPEEYNAYVDRMEKLSPKGKPPRKIDNTEPGFEKGDVKLVDTDFDALTDLPEGWAVVSCHDSGGNHGIEAAGIFVLRQIWNTWITGPNTAILHEAVTQKNFLDAKQANGEGLCGCDLADEAAQAAAKVLVVNWCDAVRDGEHPRKLFADVDDVICMLQAWRKALQHNFPTDTE